MSLKNFLLEEDNELTKMYWRHWNYLTAHWTGKLRERRYASNVKLSDEEWTQLERDAVTQVEKCETMLWWMTWKCLSKPTIDDINNTIKTQLNDPNAVLLPDKQKDFLTQIGVSVAAPGGWRKTYPWMDTYLRSASSVGVDILRAYNDEHMLVTAQEALRHDGIGLQNRRLSAELQGLLKQRVDMTSGDEPIKQGVDLAGIEAILNRAYAAKGEGDSA